MCGTFFLCMNRNHFLRIYIFTTSTLDWLWRSGSVTYKSILCLQNSVMKSVPFEVCSLDPLQTRRSITPTSPMTSFSPCPVRLFFSMEYVAAKKDLLTIAFSVKGIILTCNCICKDCSLDAWSLNNAVGSEVSLDGNNSQ